MDLISVAKLNQLNRLFYAFRPYYRNLEALLYNLISSQEIEPQLLFEKRPESKKILLCVVTSDNGLCGFYNNSVIRAAEEFITARPKHAFDLIVVGRRGLNYFKNKEVKILHSYCGLNGRHDDIVSNEIVNILIHHFVSKQSSEVRIAYMHFETAVIQSPVVEKFLNIECGLGKKKDYILEQTSEDILELLLPAYLRAKMKLMFLEAFISEHAARSLAMRAATDNARELLDDLVLLRNKVRQAGITQDMLEIISSSEALRG